MRSGVSGSRVLLSATLGICFVSGASHPSLAQTSENEPVEQVTITTKGNTAVPENVPAVVESLGYQEIHESVNAVTSAEVLKNLPSLMVRERFIGDRNGMITSRTTGNSLSAQTLMYADGILLSNLLGNGSSYAPRWGMVSPEEIERVDVMYGPFSALFPGNSFGGVVMAQTRMPDQPEVHGSLQTFTQNFKLYGTDTDYSGYHGTASVGGRAGKVAVLFSADHLDNTSQPTMFGNATTTTTGTAVAATGYSQDRDQNGKSRYIFGATSIDHTIQDNGKFKFSLDVAPDVVATYTLGLWRGWTTSSVDSYLRDSSGNPIYNGKVLIDGSKYSVSMNPSHTDALHTLNALSVKSDTKGIWDWEVSTDLYSFVDNRVHTATNYGNSNAGTIQDQDGSGWGNVDLRGIWRPTTSLLGKHEVSFGYHFDQYQLDQTTFTTDNWYSDRITGLSGVSEGKTRTQALYAQDAWLFHPDWKLTYGGRGEYWQAFDGVNKTVSNGNMSVANYTDQNVYKFSPKGSLKYQMTDQLAHVASVGRAYRFPTVTEMFQSITSGNVLVQNNPNLAPEKVWSFDWTSEYEFVKNNAARISFFQENRADALISQTNVSNQALTYFQNVGMARVRGVEVGYDAKDIRSSGLDFHGGVTFASSRILSNDNHPTSVGQELPYTPRWKTRASVVYHQDEQLSYAVSFQSAFHQKASIDGTDINRNLYGGASDYAVADLKVNYKINDICNASLGVNNVTNEKYYTSHPYSQRIFFAGVNIDY